MIILYELSQTGLSHSEFTKAFTESIAHAFAGHQIVVYGRGSHLDAAFAALPPVLDGRLIQRPDVPEDFCLGDNPLLALVKTFRFLHASYGQWVSHCPLVIFLTGEPRHILAAKLLKRLRPSLRCHLVLHGDIASLTLPRARHPLRRFTDYTASITLANHDDIRLVTLESHIKRNLTALFPEVEPYVDVVRCPYNRGNAHWHAAIRDEEPVRFGLLGIAGRSKGLDIFARLATEIMDAFPRAAEFRVIGKMQHGYQDLDLSAVSGPRPFSETWLPAEVFEVELDALRYVVLPYNMEYYAFAASAVLLDALGWRKPLVAFRTPAICELSERFGEIGHICDSYDEMADTVTGILSGFDPERYAAQCRNLDAAFQSRQPRAIAGEYSAVVRSRWGARFAAGAASHPVNL